MDPICFENAKRVTAKHVERHIQLQKSLKITPYAALYIEPSKRGIILLHNLLYLLPHRFYLTSLVDYSKTPLIEYAFAPKNTKSNEANEKKITPTQASRKPTITVSRPEIIKSTCFQKVKENYRLMDPICFENAKRVTAKHVERHIQLQKSLKITPYAALYVEPSKRGIILFPHYICLTILSNFNLTSLVDYSKTPLIEYAFAPKNTKSNETSEKKTVIPERELSILNRMGFHDNQKNIETLKKTNGNLSDAVEYLLCIQ
jgi:hypothetical protein